ncbi:histidine phosphatase family protein [Paenibacillus sp. KS-LC4]|uniref:histidine phosphatase family protein n=1 Tax=Paenibacillus sp. KS-LC4 TaxID=2979727 RepID=UPI0030D359B5
MIYVVRHGQTDYNKEQRMQGRSGLPLNAQGIKQAEQLRERLRDVTFHFVFSSPQERAVQTAEIATGATAIIDARLDAFDLGEADKLKTSEVKMKGFTPDPSVYKGVEGTDQFAERIFSFMSELEAKNDGKEVNILIAGHACTTGCMGAYFNGIPADRNITRYSSANGDYKTYEFKSEMAD